MTRTAIIVLAVVLILLALSMMGFMPAIVTEVGLIIEAILIIGGSRLSR